MSDSESEQENEITFRSSLHHGVGLPSSQPEQEGPCLTDGPRKKNSAMSAIDGQSRDDHVYSKNQGSSQTWMENAVKDMVSMQSQMSQALQSVTTLLTSICHKDQHPISPEEMEMDINHHSNPGRGQGESDTGYLGSNQGRHSNYAENEGEGHPTYARSFHRRNNHNSHHCTSNVKIPAFSGNDGWKVWINRFETIAERQNWDEDQKLDNLLPKLQGSAGEFVFTQLKRDTLRDYRELVSEINNRFRVIETPRTFAAKFSKRNQKPNETAEEYAAELKRLYDKAHNRRDSRTRKEDLVRRFMDGLRDEEVRWEVEYIKEPDDIDEAVYHVVNYIQTRRRHLFTQDTEKKGKFIRRTQSQLCREITSDSEAYESDTGEDAEHVYRVPVKGHHGNQKADNKISPPQNGTKDKDDNINTSNAGSAGEIASTDSQILQQLLEKLIQLTQAKTSAPGTQNGQIMKKKIIRCYSCNQENHFARDCPFKSQQFQYGGNANTAPQPYAHRPNDQQLNVHAPVFNQPLNMNGPSRLAGGRS